PVDDVRLRFREERAQFVDIDEFDIDNMPEPGVAQSITLGSKMNHDRLRHAGGEFDQEFDNNDEPPFA
ncbi:MAG: hypothetical protein JXN62_03985, partial [Bacteroidales bacterium]|nr:hypothetical protein [Bacteroidales bacterium]